MVEWHYNLINRATQNCPTKKNQSSVTVFNLSFDSQTCWFEGKPHNPRVLFVTKYTFYNYWVIIKWHIKVILNTDSYIELSSPEVT